MVLILSDEWPPLQWSLVAHFLNERLYHRLHFSPNRMRKYERGHPEGRQLSKINKISQYIMLLIYFENRAPGLSYNREKARGQSSM